MDHGFLNGSDFVGITFWIVSIAMWASTIFFFYEGMRVSAKWRTSVSEGVVGHALLSHICCSAKSKAVRQHLIAGSFSALKSR